jgi:hypothetical protein
MTLDPELEHALLAHHRKHRLRGVLTIVLGLAFALAAVVCAITHAVKTRQLVAFGVLGSFGILLGTASLKHHRSQLLERLRSGIPIREIRRERLFPNSSAKQLPRIAVDFVDGETASILCEQADQARIEMLLRTQMNG